MSEEAFKAANARHMRIWIPKPGAPIGTVSCQTCGWNGDVRTDFAKYAIEPFGCGRKMCGNFARREDK